MQKIGKVCYKENTYELGVIPRQYDTIIQGSGAAICFPSKLILLSEQSLNYSSKTLLHCLYHEIYHGITNDTESSEFQADVFATQHLGYDIAREAFIEGGRLKTTKSARVDIITKYRVSAMRGISVCKENNVIVSLKNGSCFEEKDYLAGFQEKLLDILRVKKLSIESLCQICGSRLMSTDTCSNLLCVSNSK